MFRGKITQSAHVECFRSSLFSCDIFFCKDNKTACFEEYSISFPISFILELSGLYCVEHFHSFHLLKKYIKQFIL